MILFKYYALVAVALSTGANAVAPWNHGDRLKIFVAPTGPHGRCPEKSPTDPAGVYTQLFYNGQNVVLDALDRVDKQASTFFITNGWHSTIKDGESLGPGTQTRIQLAYNGSTATGCLRAIPDQGTLGLIQCSFDDESQGFWIQQLNEDDAFSISYITAAKGMAKLARPPDQGPAVVLKGTPGRVCVYNADNDWSISAGKTYIPGHALTRLWGQQIPGSDKPTDWTTLPGCKNPDGSSNINSQDCIVAISYNRAPAECATQPTATDCVLNYLGAFCGDYVLGRQRAGNPIPDNLIPTELEACVRKISLGPCVANPSGAACTSGLFAGIAFPGLGGSGAPSSKRQDLAAQYAIFPEERVKDHIFEEFVIGLAKEFFNSISSMAKSMFNSQAEHSVVWCQGLAGALNSTALRDKCSKIWGLHNRPAPQLEMDNRVQNAGAVTAVVISTVMAINDVVNAVRAMNPETWAALKNLFKAPEAVEATVGADKVKGFIIRGTNEAKDGGVVEVAQLKPETGDVVPFESEQQAQAALEDAVQNGFVDCEEMSVPVRWKIKRGAGGSKGLKLGCFAESSSSSGSDGSPPPTYRLKYQVGKLTEAAELSAPQKALLDSMRASFSSVFAEGKSVAVEADAVTQAFYDAKYTQKFAKKILPKAKALYGVTDEEIRAISNGMYSFVENEEVLAAGLAQLPPTSGLCLRTADLSAEAFDMLTTMGPGLRSQKTGGVYEVEDLLRIRKTLYGEEFAVPESLEIMSSFLGVEREYNPSAEYRFVINSKAGRYIEPLLGPGSTFPEVDFVQGYSEFKLLGWEELNGGAAAKAAVRHPGPYAVFYFDEVDLGGAKPRICGGTVTTSCRAANVAPPTFP